MSYGPISNEDSIEGEGEVIQPFVDWSEENLTSPTRTFNSSTNCVLIRIQTIVDL